LPAGLADHAGRARKRVFIVIAGHVVLVAGQMTMAIRLMRIGWHKITGALSLEDVTQT